MIDVKMEDRWIEEKTESETGWVSTAAALSYYHKACKHQSPPQPPLPPPEMYRFIWKLRLQIKAWLSWSFPVHQPSNKNDVKPVCIIPRRLLCPYS